MFVEKGGQNYDGLGNVTKGGGNAMTMEHRWQKRNSSNLDVAVYKKGKHLGCAQAVDMSLEGIGLACTLDLKKGEVVEIELPEEGRYGYARYLVVHAGHGRCGLMFISLSERGEQ